MGLFCSALVWGCLKPGKSHPRRFSALPGDSGFPADSSGTSGLTVMELVMVLIIITAVAIVAIPAISSYMDDLQNTEAISRLTAIELSLDKYYAEYGAYPDSLARVGKDSMKDPWGHPYVYLPLPAEEKLRYPVARRTREVRLVNSDYDLYSPGKDGRTDLCMNKERCWDDVVRAYNGSYTGLAKDIL
jgi:general secretion pathway protein G